MECWGGVLRLCHPRPRRGREGEGMERGGGGERPSVCRGKALESVRRRPSKILDTIIDTILEKCTVHGLGRLFKRAEAWTPKSRTQTPTALWTRLEPLTVQREAWRSQGRRNTTNYMVFVLPLYSFTYLFYPGYLKPIYIIPTAPLKDVPRSLSLSSRCIKLPLRSLTYRNRRLFFPVS